MAAAAPSATIVPIVNDHSDYGSEVDYTTPPTSEYGSEFDHEETTLIGDLLERITSTAPVEKTLILPSVEQDEGTLPTVLLHKSPPSSVVRLEKGANVSLETRRVERSASVEVEYDGASRETWSVPRDLAAIPSKRRRPSQLEHTRSDAKNNEPDTRSPLERFRTKPKKPLSVTDLVSPTWCELQYWYVLTKFGRKPQTQAMKQGSKVHRTLEEQVHVIVPVQVVSKEDRFGLKLWNTIQGLRTLRKTGLTRELEIWGIIHGQVVNGIIDEISYTCPDPDLEESLEKSRIQKDGGTLPLGQLSIEQSLTHANGGNEAKPWLGSLKPERMVYVADVKTRGAKTVPAGASLRPTWMQLMLYRKMLQALAQNTVDAETIFARYSLEPLEPFTETFLHELGGFDGGGTPLDEANPFAILQTSEIEDHNNLSALWSLMISEFSRTMDSFSDILRAEFRFSRTGELIGSEVFAYEAKQLDEHVNSEMLWWNGAREAKGVEIEEAFKCRVCDFADECTWRKTKIEEATEKHRLKLAERAKSAV